jgi:hypothetical protein
MVCANTLPFAMADFFKPEPKPESPLNQWRILSEKASIRLVKASLRSALQALNLMLLLQSLSLVPGRWVYWTGLEFICGEHGQGASLQAPRRIRAGRRKRY